jgi:anti-anti-sigma factor
MVATLLGTCTPPPVVAPPLVEVAGEIDFASAPELRDCLRQMIDGGGRHLVVDLRQVSLMDSVGLGVLVGARERVRGDPSGAGSIHLVCADGMVWDADIRFIMLRPRDIRG